MEHVVELRPQGEAVFPFVRSQLGQFGRRVQPRQVRVGSPACQYPPRPEPGDAAARQDLWNTYWNRARALDLLHRYPESMKDWQKATELSPKPESLEFRASRAISLARAGQVSDAVADVAELTKTGNYNADQWYCLACVYAVASAKAIDQKQEYAERSMELLPKAVQAGWKNGAYMAKDPDLDPLRERQDFKRVGDGGEPFFGAHSTAFSHPPTSVREASA